MKILYAFLVDCQESWELEFFDSFDDLNLDGFEVTREELEASSYRAMTREVTLENGEVVRYFVEEF